MKKSLSEAFPELTKEWHPSKNDGLDPTTIPSGAHTKVWWYLPFDDPVSQKHFDFEWQATINSRTSQKAGCPFLSGNAVWPGYNDLATRYPQLAEEWHPTKNGDLRPEDFTYASNQKVWWFLSYYDSKTGKQFPFEWQACISDRTIKNNGCPFLAGLAVWPGFNDLKSCFPEIAREWHPTKNKGITPDSILASSTKKVWWLLVYYDPETRMEFPFEWEACVRQRTRDHAGCPYLANKKVYPGFNDLASKFPIIAREWHPTKNGSLTPQDVYWGSTKKVWWLIHYEDPDTGSCHGLEYVTIAFGKLKLMALGPFLCHVLKLQDGCRSIRLVCFYYVVV